MSSATTNSAAANSATVAAAAAGTMGQSSAVKGAEKLADSETCRSDADIDPGAALGQVVLNQLMQLQNAYYNACATLVLGVLLLLGYLNVQLVGTYFTALVAALLTGLVLRQPKLALEAWLKCESVLRCLCAFIAFAQ